MKKVILLSSFAALLLNCNKKAEAPVKETASVDTTTTKEQDLDTVNAKSSCYMGVTGKDTVFASIDDNLGTITGKLRYKNNEKDGSKGDVTGFKSGDTLKLTYEFQSEGSKSKRDIYFIRKNNTLIEGIGEQKDENGQMKYANDNKISYKEGQKLEPANCTFVTKALK
jgi:hypothetical protein